MNPTDLRVAAIFILLACVTATTGAHADAAVARDANSIAAPRAQRAREHQKRGNALYRIREFEAAAAEYKQGLAVEDAPVFAYNLGQCYRQLGKYEDAIWHFRRFLARAPSPSRRAIVERLVTEMTNEMQQRARSALPTDAEGDGPTVATLATPAAMSAAAPTPIPAPANSKWYSDSVAWGLTGAGATIGAGSVILLLSARGLDREGNLEPDTNEKEDLHARADTRRLVGAVIGVAAGGLLIAGVIKLALPSRTASASRVSVGIAGGGIVGYLRF